MDEDPTSEGTYNAHESLLDMPARIGRCTPDTEGILNEGEYLRFNVVFQLPWSGSRDHLSFGFLTTASKPIPVFD